jgi:4-hydroxybenzoate polyprenyltransferase
MRKQQWVVLVVLGTFFAVSILVHDLRIRPNLEALPLHLFVLCGAVVFFVLLYRYGPRWRYFDLFRPLMVAVLGAGLAIGGWYMRHEFQAALCMFFAFIFAWIAFDEWKKLKIAAKTQGIEGQA